MNFVLGILFLLVIDIVLSVDNAILIASTTKDLEEGKRKWAQFFGGLGAVVLRLVFVILLMVVGSALNDTIIVYILGGAVLVFIGFTLMKGHNEDGGKAISKNASIWKAVMLIMAGDIMMSFDNAIVIAEVSMNTADAVWVRIVLVTIALLISLVVILFFAKQIANFMNKNDWVIYLASFLLMGLGLEMIIKDPVFGHWQEEWSLLIMACSYLLSFVVTAITYYFREIRWAKQHKDINSNNEEATSIVKESEIDSKTKKVDKTK